MFDAVRSNRRIVQVFLVLVSVPFAIWGLESYQGGGGSSYVAKVGDALVTRAEFQEVLSERRNAMRAELPPNADPGILDSAEVRETILNGLVVERLIFQEVREHRLEVDPVLRDVIAKMSEFQENGKFSEARYQSALAANGITPGYYEGRMRQNIQFQFLIGSLSETGFAPRTVTSRIARLQLEEREVQTAPISWKGFANAAKPGEDELRKFYDEHAERFSQPEEARVAYVVLRDIPEARRASHILFLTDGMPAEEKPKIRAEAERVLALVRKDPSAFASLAKQYSQDTGSVQLGGDLNFFTRKSMVKSFEDAVFSMQKGEISDIVETDFGFHIIMLTDIRAARYGADFARVTDDFSNRLFENPESLKPTAEQFGLEVLESGPLTREVGDKDGVLGHPKVRAAIFSDAVLKDGVNSDAIVTGESELVAVRLLEHKPASRLPFEQVKKNIEEELRQQGAMAFAVEKGRALLADFAQGKNVPAVRWGPAQTISRREPGNLGDAALRAVFEADVGTLPVVVGVELPGEGFALYRINKVTAQEANEGELANLGAQLAIIQGRTQLEAYVAALRQKHKVEIDRNAME